MHDRAPERLARAVLRDYLGLRPRESLTLEAWSHALEWVRPFVVEARRVGAEPVLALEDEEAFFRSVADLPRNRLPTAPSALAALSGAYVYFGGPERFSRLLGLKAADRRAVLDRHGPAWREAARRSRTRVARLAISGATRAAAERYGVDVDAWQGELLAASLVPPDRLAAAAEPIRRRLARARRMRILHGNGTDLELEIARRPLVVDDGRSVREPPRYTTDVPTGRVIAFVRPRSAHGSWESNRPRFDRFAEIPVQLGARFQFAGGRMREFEFDRGGAAFASEYAAGGRGRDTVGAIVFGVNPRIARAPEAGELAAETVSLRLGAASADRGSAFSCSTTLAEPEVRLDGRAFLVDGRAVR